MKWLWREGIYLWTMAMVLMWGSSAWSAESVSVPNDREITTVVVGKDTPREIERKLGASPTISKDPPLSGVCYSPVLRSVPLRTSKGVQLGATSDEVIRLYGKPNETFAVGPLMRFRYVSMLDRPYEWDLVFRNGRLVEWTVVTEE